MTSILKGKRILVTGGTGSIGSSLVTKALKEGAIKINVFSNDEFGLYEMEENFEHNKKIHFFIGDIRDEDVIDSVVKDCDIVFHAAALKHVDRCESNPFEAVTVNIMGTRNLIRAAIREKVKKFIFISTDKAVTPFGVMGATKLLAEKLISAESTKNHYTIFSTVRFGNVLHTRGSILPRVEAQIRKGGPITLTDKRMKRFFMTRDDAVNLILSATKMALGGETFVLKMPVIKLEDLFEMMKKLLAPKYNYNISKIKTKIIGIRRGEKLIEELLTNYEMEFTLETKEFFIIPQNFDLKKKSRYKGAKISNDPNSYLKKLRPLSKKMIFQLLKEVY